MVSVGRKRWAKAAVGAFTAIFLSGAVWLSGYGRVHAASGNSITASGASIYYPQSNSFYGSLYGGSQFWQLTFSLPHNSYQTGETLPVTFSVDNNSGDTLDYPTVSFTISGPTGVVSTLNAQPSSYTMVSPGQYQLNIPTDSSWTAGTYTISASWYNGNSVATASFDMVAPNSTSSSSSSYTPTYASECAACHGANGQGGVGPSFSQMAKDHPTIDDLATFIQKNMPLGLGGSLSLSDATNIAAYILASPSATPPAVDVKFPNINGLTVSIDGEAQTVSPGATIAQLQWNWGDDTSNIGSFPQTHTYAQPGSYTVTITATDSNGLRGSSSVPVQVSAPPAQTPPTVQLDTSSMSITGYAVTLVATADPTAPGATITKVEYNWGDGSPAQASKVEQETSIRDGVVSNIWPGSHAYAQAGTYTITVTATDSNGLSGSAQTTVQVSAPTQEYPPSVTLTDTSSQGLTVTQNGFADEALANGSNDTITKLVWDWGDGTPTQTGSFPQSHTYAQTGNYVITVTATDSSGLTGSDHRLVQFSVPTAQPTLPTVQLDKPTVLSDGNGLSVAINGSEINPSGYGMNQPVWNWGDGTPTQTGWWPMNHTYANAGTYTVTVTITDAGGLTYSGHETIQVTTQPTPAPTPTTPTDQPSQPPTFNDLGDFSWAQSAIESLAAQGIIKGVATGQFDPSGLVTRGQFAALMRRAFNLSQPSTSVTFSDVQSSDWDYSPIEAAIPYMDYYNQIGGGNSFHPDQPFDRQDVAAVMVRLLVSQGDTTLLSQTQAQSVLASVSDVGDIAPALQRYVATAIQDKIMIGVPGGGFDPLGLLNRAQVAVVLDRMMNDFLTVGK